MIEKNTFIREFAMILDRFGREMGGPSIERYREFLNTELTTEEFQAAARIIFEEDQFFPAPRRFVDAIQGGLTELATSEWLQLLDLAQRNNSDLSSLTDTARAALKTAGGWTAVAHAQGEFGLERVRKRFIEGYQWARNRKSRPELEKPEPAVLEGVL